MKVSKFISFRDENNKIVFESDYQNFHSKLLRFYRYIYFLHTCSGEKSIMISHFIQPGVFPRRGNREFSSALSNSDSQFVHASQGKHASTCCLSWDSASLHLQFPPLWTPKPNSATKCTDDSVFHAQRTEKWEKTSTNFLRGK